MRRSALALAAAVAVALPVVALALMSSCSLQGLTDGPDAGSGGRMSTSTGPNPPASSASTGAGGDGGADAGDDSGKKDCPTDMISVPAPAGGQPFCIDETEVTNAAYAKFLAMGWPTNVPKDVCGWNSKYDAVIDPDKAPPNEPVAGVDWCDAFQYCRAVGKRLCGSTKGGPVDPTLNSFVGDQWYAACTKGGNQALPYGGVTVDLERCNDCSPGAKCDPDASVPDASEIEDVASRPKCEGGYKGVFDLSGNVWEWEDSCFDGGVSLADAADPGYDHCWRRGGAYDVPHNPNPKSDCLKCAACSSGSVQRKLRATDTGFRCCFDR